MSEHSSNNKTDFSPQLWYPHVVGGPMPCIYLTFFIYLNTMSYFFKRICFKYGWTKYSDNISQVYLCREHPKPNVDKGDILLMQVSGILFLLILFVIMSPSPDIHINLSHVSQPKNSIYFELEVLKNTSLSELIFLTFIGYEPVFLESNISVCNHLFQTLIFQVHS